MGYWLSNGDTGEIFTAVPWLALVNVVRDSVRDGSGGTALDSNGCWVVDAEMAGEITVPNGAKAAAVSGSGSTTTCR